jgi:hypothetical protein
MRSKRKIFEKLKKNEKKKYIVLFLFVAISFYLIYAYIEVQQQLLSIANSRLGTNFQV